MLFSFTAPSYQWSKDLQWNTSFLHCALRGLFRGRADILLCQETSSRIRLLKTVSPSIINRAWRRQSYRISKYTVYSKSEQPRITFNIILLVYTKKSFFSTFSDATYIRHSCLLHGLSSSSSFSHSQVNHATAPAPLFLADLPLSGTNTLIT